jgi:hypothetical protein
MHRRFLCLVAAVAVLAGPASVARASSPSFIAATTTPDRYMPVLAFDYGTAVSVADPATQVSLHRSGSAAAVPFTLSGSGTSTLTIQVTGSLAAGQTYVASVLVDGESSPDIATWTTRAVPLHPTTRIKIVTALEPDAVEDIVRRLDRSNVTAVPRPADLVDVAADTGGTLTSADLTGYHVALVVTDQDVWDQIGLGSALAAFAAKGRGVVLGGQTHWTTGGTWTAASAIGGNTGTWATNWSPLGYFDPPAVEGGTLVKSSIVPHYLTRGLTALDVQTAGSGIHYVHQSWTAQVLAKLQSPSYAGGQAILATHWETKDHPGRVVDLGFNPWSSAVASGGGGFDPSQPGGAQAGPLIARAVWWAANRIPPVSTRFTSKPPRVHQLATVLFTMTATDPDKSSPFATLRYQYRVNKGRWNWARGGTSFALYHLPAGRSYTVRARAVDFAGNIDPRPAVYRFRLTSDARG